MKQKLTIMIADVQMNIVTEESPEAVENLRRIVDRRIREIYLQSGNRCPKTEAALLCALDYCSDRIRAQRKVKAVESKLAMTEATLDELIAENEALKEELRKLQK